jgi:hypothetical protein
MAKDIRFEGKDNHGKPRSDYLARIAEKSDTDLFEETENKIWLSAFAANNPRSDYHWHVDACYSEWVKRGKPKEYERAFEAAKKSAGC